MILRNVHTAEVAGLDPGAIGDLDPGNPGVRVCIAGGLLVPPEAPAFESPAVVDPPVVTSEESTPAPATPSPQRGRRGGR